MKALPFAYLGFVLTLAAFVRFIETPGEPPPACGLVEYTANHDLPANRLLKSGDLVRLGDLDSVNTNFECKNLYVGRYIAARRRESEKVTFNELKTAPEITKRPYARFPVDKKTFEALNAGSHVDVFRGTNARAICGQAEVLAIQEEKGLYFAAVDWQGCMDAPYLLPASPASLVLVSSPPAP